jgi:phosphoserine phosphatase RsbU/P
MKLRTAILLAMLGVLVTLVGATVVVLSLRLERDATEQRVAALARAGAVYTDLHALRQSLYRSETLTVAQEPRLKAVLGTAEIDRATIVDVAGEMQKSGGADLFVLLDADGHLLVDTAAPAESGHDLTAQPVVRAALLDGEAGGVWTQAQRVYQVHARRLGFGDDIVGVLILGHLDDERVVETVRRQTGSGAVLVLDGGVVGEALADPALADVAGELSDPALAPALAAIAGELGDAVEERRLLGQRLLLRAVAVPGYAGERALRCVLVESLDVALATGKVLRLWIYGVAALTLLGAAIVAWLLARRISRPVDRLVEFTGDIAAGRLDVRAPLRGPIEVQALAVALNQMASDLAASREHMAARQRLERELEIAANIQTSILPRDRSAPGVELDARMRPASEVGGDYYDILPVADGCWLGIGDVAGHGLTAGIVMLMVQSLIAVLVQERPDARPAQLIPALNAMLYKNIRGRLAQDDHVTLTLLRVFTDGRVYFAGAHEDIIVCRAADGRCERVETPGTWLGVVPEVAAGMPDSQLRLQPGDLMLLYSDGATEAMNATREQYGPDRLGAALAAVRERSVAEICDHLLAEVIAWTAVQRDDITLLVMRHRGVDRS